MIYSRNQMMAMAQNNPAELAKILSSPDADVHTLTFGAELLGEEVTDETLVLPVLRRLLKHFNAIVREGAVAGVASFYYEKMPPQDILDRLEEMRKGDPSPSIKEYISSLMEDFKII
jgi:hypothetical protein